MTSPTLAQLQIALSRVPSQMAAGRVPTCVDRMYLTLLQMWANGEPLVLAPVNKQIKEKTGLSYVSGITALEWLLEQGWIETEEYSVPRGNPARFGHIRIVV